MRYLYLLCPCFCNCNNINHKIPTGDCCCNNKNNKIITAECVNCKQEEKQACPKISQKWQKCSENGLSLLIERLQRIKDDSHINLCNKNLKQLNKEIDRCEYNDPVAVELW